MNSENLLTAVTLLLGIVEQASKVASVIQQAQAEGRDLTVEELAAFRQADDIARERLETAIAQAQGEQNGP